MTFIQIISFRTDSYDEFPALEQKWLDATEGKRTLLREQRLVDRSDPRHYVHVNEFASYESAMENSNLPETDAVARELAALTGGVDFGDYDVIAESDIRHQLAATLHRDLASGVVSEAFAEDVAFEGQWPNHIVRGSGPAFIGGALQEEAPARTFERWDVTVTESGFVAEYAYRTTEPVSHLSLGIMVATVERTRISRLVATCGGSWDAAAEETILGALAGTEAVA